ncbi:D-alanyl-D-alanine carboxypeptidase family protein [Anatilimnocola floriformis]|uniref:D-alanyl-D-alanine carboxypeptidase family protein n=1 Tax=Anatilimnocola floriformis TaxID=2948575 RepID=UPI0020C24E88|nr:serine hydrolase [Anatilimnocola floriformis]
MNRRNFLLSSALALTCSRSFAQDPKQKPDRLAGPPLVTAKGWAIIDAENGKFLWGEHENEPLVIASTTKIMTAWLTLQLAKDKPEFLQQRVTISEAAAKTTGSSAKVEAGDRFVLRELLHGLLLPSGNDAAAAIAEHCGPAYRQKGDPDDAVEAFVAQMNRQANDWKLAQTKYFDPHGLGKNHASPANLAQIAWQAMQNETFRKIVSTRRYEGTAVDAKDEKRTVVWNNTNRLLEIEGFVGIKTGTTTAAGNCLVSQGQRGKDKLIIVVLGSTSADGRYVDTRNLYRWAWRERGHKDE